jgi:TolB protein
MNTKAFLNSSVMLALMTGLWLIPVSPSFAAFPGANGMIAFTSDRDGDFEIYVMNPDGSAQTNLTNNPASDSNPVWSPDGTKIAFQSNRTVTTDVYVMDAHGTVLRNLTNSNPNSCYEPTWSPDGTKIAFGCTPPWGGGYGNLYWMNADGTGDMHKLTDNVNKFPSAFAPAWSPDGTKIAFSQSLNDSITEIYVIRDLDPLSLEKITKNGINSMRPDWSPDGTQIVFERGPAGSSNVWVMNPNGSDQTNLTNNNPGQINVSPRWSPDGTQIVFESYYHSGGRYQIYVMNGNGTNPINISNSSNNDHFPDWQPVPISVEIDIKPGSFPNSINPRSQGVIPVAILTTSAFDATMVDALSVKFGPAGATESHGRSHIEDIDSDGDLDLVLHFRTQATGIQCGDTSASLTGKTISGTAIQGADSIRTVGCK